MISNLESGYICRANGTSIIYSQSHKSKLEIDDEYFLHVTITGVFYEDIQCLYVSNSTHMVNLFSHEHLCFAVLKVVSSEDALN